MSVSRGRSGRKRGQSLLELLISRYKGEPDKFRSFLPEIADRLDVMLPGRRAKRNPFSLTEGERSRRLASFREGLTKKGSGSLTKEEAIETLQDYAALLEDDGVPDEFDFDKRLMVLKAALGKGPGSFKSPTTVEILPSSQESIVSRASLVRGVVLQLTWDLRLLSVTISPQRFRDRKRIVAFVGAGQDSASDVARRHDEYFVETIERGAS